MHIILLRIDSWYQAVLTKINETQAAFVPVTKQNLMLRLEYSYMIRLFQRIQHKKIHLTG